MAKSPSKSRSPAPARPTRSSSRKKTPNRRSRLAKYQHLSAKKAATASSPKRRPNNVIEVDFGTPQKSHKRAPTPTPTPTAAPSPGILRTPGYSASGNAVNWTPKKRKLEFDKNSPPASVSKNAAHTTSQEELSQFVDKGATSNRTCMRGKKLALLATVTESDSYETLPETFIRWPLMNMPVMLGRKKTQEFLYRHMSLSADRGLSDEHGRFDLLSDRSDGTPHVSFTDLGRNNIMTLLNGQPLEPNVPSRYLQDGDLLTCSGTTLKLIFLMVNPIRLTEEDIDDFEIDLLKQHLACRALHVCGVEAILRKRLVKAIKREEANTC